MIRQKAPKLSQREKELIAEHQIRLRSAQLESELSGQLTRGRSVSVGTAFGGASEISIRRGDGSHTWVIMQPVEVVELINQLAANIGCHIHLQPRQDFASWRAWNHTQEELEHFRGGQRGPGDGHAPHAKAIINGGYDTSLPKPEEQPGMPTPMLEEKDAETMAIETPKRRRASKRAAASS